MSRATLPEWLANRFELSRGGAGGNLLAMEGLRGYAVFLVFLVHYVSSIEPWMQPGSPLFRAMTALHSCGNAGVDLFFVLSGYLIYGHLIGAPRAFRPYMRRRVQRIYPAFLAVFAVYLLASFLHPGRSKLPDAAGAAMGYVAANLLLLPGLLPITPIITVAWSLSYEMFFYLAVPAVIAVAKLRERSAQRRLVFVAVLLAACLTAGACLGGPVRMSMFLVGMILYEWLPRRRAFGSWAAILALGLSFVAMLLPLSGSEGQAARTAMLGASFFVLCSACIGSRPAAVQKAFCWTPLRWLGNMSYSFYLIHGLTLNVLFFGLTRWYPPTPDPVFCMLLAIPTLAAATLVSAFLFIGIERPLSLRASAAPRA